MKKKQHFDEVKKTYIKSCGHSTDYIWECEWHDLIRRRPEIMEQVKAAQLLKYEGPAWTPGGMNEEEIKQLVRTEQLFGFVRVDISIENESLKRRCREFSPFFKHAHISLADIGDHMRDFADGADMLKQPQRALIGAMHAENFWVGTPLLRWYLRMGFHVSKIHEVVQYEGANVFDTFVDNITKTRRSADLDPDLEIRGLCAKLEGTCIPFIYICLFFTYIVRLRRNKEHTHKHENT